MMKRACFAGLFFSRVNKQLRDKAFTLLFEKESTIRECGRYFFWKDEGLRSKYYK